MKKGCYICHIYGNTQYFFFYAYNFKDDTDQMDLAEIYEKRLKEAPSKLQC